MLSGSKIIYRCAKCDSQFSKWQGRCPECGAWGSLEKQIVNKEKSKLTSGLEVPEVETLTDVVSSAEKKLVSGINEFDRVLGGGVVPGSLVLLGGDPGVGKSTLALQVGGKLASFREVLYISGEESSSQIKMRFSRLGLKTEKLKFLGETDIEKICLAVDSLRPSFVIVDSIQTMHSGGLDSEAGSVGQVKAATARLNELSKRHKIAILVIGHVTKKGNVAGPMTLEHLVDVVLYFEGDRYHAYRILRSVKNRFGSTNEVGIFEMRTGGLKEVVNPSQIFLAERRENAAGSVVTAMIEGSRAFLVEIQSLVSRTNFGYPQRRSAGFDLNRLQLLVAVLIKKAGFFLGSYDIHLNVAGGFKINEPAVDLAVCLAIASAFKNKPLPQKTAVFGEVGLGGEIRSVGQPDKRLSEIKKMGFTRAIIPPVRLENNFIGLEVVQYRSVAEAIEVLL